MNTHYEQIIAHEIARIIPDLRLIDLSHYVCHLQQEHYGNIADLVDDVCNMHFHPLTLRFIHKGDFCLAWGRTPTVRLLMKFCNLGLSASFYLTLKASCFSIVLQRITYSNAHHSRMTPQKQAQYLSRALHDAHFTSTEKL